MRKRSPTSARRRRTLVWFCVGALIPLLVGVAAQIGLLGVGGSGLADLVFIPGAIIGAVAGYICTGDTRVFLDIPAIWFLLGVSFWGIVGACIAVATQGRRAAT